MRWRTRVLVAWAALALFACARLRACFGDDSVAVLEQQTGVAARAHGALTSWSNANPGDKFVVDDALRTGTGSHASVGLTSGGGLQLGPETTVRFLAHPLGAGHTAIRVDSGEAEIDSRGDAVMASTAFGMVRIDPGSRVTLHAAGDGTRFEVDLGHVEFERPGETSVSAAAGNRLEVTIAGAIMEPLTSPPHVARSASATPAPVTAAATSPTTHEADGSTVAADASAQAGTVAAADDAGRAAGGAAGSSDSRSAHVTRTAEASDENPVPSTEASGAELPHVADFAIGAGESVTVHDMSPSTAVRIEFGAACTGAGHVDVTGGPRHLAIEATGSTIIPVPEGAVRYVVHCGAGRPRSGRVRHVRDLAAAPIPRSAPRTFVDADGRRYTVLYQNLLPEITFRWARPPTATAYALVVRGPSGPAQTVPSSSPSVALPSGRLQEGTYHFQFETRAGPAEHSRDTTLQIGFDNAARAAQIREPSENSHPHGDTVHVTGTAAPGSSVSANGTVLQLDGQNRFQGNVAVVHEGAGLVIRIAHRALGVHVYVRHLNGTGTP